MSILSNGNVYDCYPNSGSLPRVELCNEGQSTGQVSIVTIRTDLNMYWEQPPQVIIPDVLAPTIVTPPPPPPPTIVNIDPPPPPPVVITPAGDPPPVITTPSYDHHSAVPEPSALYLVGPGLVLMFVGFRRKAAK